jgi:hypothetical protein
VQREGGLVVLYGRGHLNCIDGEERVRLVHGGLCPLRGAHRVLHRPTVQSQLLGQRSQGVVVGVVNVGPYQGVLLGQVIRNGSHVQLNIDWRTRPPHPARELRHVIRIAPVAANFLIYPTLQGCAPPCSTRYVG